MARKSARSITLDANCRAMRVYPVEGTTKDVASLTTIGLRLTKEQAAHLACVLLAASREWDEMELTAYRKERRKADGTYHITVTTNSAD